MVLEKKLDFPNGAYIHYNTPITPYVNKKEIVLEKRTTKEDLPKEVIDMMPQFTKEDMIDLLWFACWHPEFKPNKISAHLNKCIFSEWLEQKNASNEK